MANETNRKQAPRLGLGASVLTALSGGLAGIGRGSLGASAEAGSKKAQQSLNRNQQQFDRGQAQLRQDRSDSIAERKLKRSESSDANLQAQRKLALDNTFDAMRTKATNTNQQQLKTGLFSKISVINAQAGVISGALSIASEGDMNKADERSGYSKDIASMQTSMGMALKASQETNPELKAKYAQSRDQAGKDILEYKETSGGLTYRMKGGPWQLATEENGMKTLTEYTRNKEGNFNQSLYDIQEKTDTGAGARKYAETNFSQIPDLPSANSTAFASGYAQAVANNPLASRGQKMTHLMNNFLKKKNLTEPQQGQTEMLQFEMGISEPVFDQNGDAWINAKELRQYATQGLVGGIPPSILEGENGMVLLDEKLVSQIRNETELTQTYDHFNNLAQTQAQGFRQDRARELGYKKKEALANANLQDEIAEKRTAKETAKMVASIKSHNFSSSTPFEAIAKVHNMSYDEVDMLERKLLGKQTGSLSKFNEVRLDKAYKEATGSENSLKEDLDSDENDIAKAWFDKQVDEGTLKNVSVKDRASMRRVLYKDYLKNQRGKASKVDPKKPLTDEEEALQYLKG